MKAYHNYHRLLVCLLLACLGATLSAQNVKEDIKQINETYRSLKGAQVELEYRYYSGDESQNPEVLKGTAAWQNGQQKMVMPSLERLQNERFALLVNHEMKTIIIQNAPAAANLPSPIPLDSILAFCEDIQYLEKGKGLVAYRFYLNALGFESVEVVFNARTYLIEQIICQQISWEAGEKGDRMEVHYRHLKKLSSQNALNFSEQQYVRPQGEDFLVQTAYQGYELYNFCRQ